MKIRKATKNDTEKIEYICIQTADEALREDEITSQITAKMYSSYYIKEETDYCYVAENESGVQGYILCAPNYSRFKNKFRKIQVKEIFKLNFFQGIFSYFLPLAYFPFRKKYPAHMHIDILSSYTGAGTGSELISTLLNRLKSENISGIMLVLGSKNIKAKRFYERHGFHRVYSLFGATTMVKKL